MSETPITDHEESIDNGDTRPLFATMRKLERELTATKAQLADIRQRLKAHPDSQLDGENGLAAATMRGYEQLQAEADKWRNVADRLAVALDDCNTKLVGWHGLYESQVCADDKEAFENADKALATFETAKLTPFLP